jgi:SAM-dependent methyltransferase
MPVQLENLPADVTGLSLGCGDPVAIAGLQPGEVVLDLGSGAGLDCFLAARQVGAQGRVIGVDMTPEMLARAETNRVALGLSNVEFRQGHIETLPVEDQQVDVVISNCVVNLSPDKPAVMREAFRVLKPGGRVSITDIVIQGEFSPALRTRMDLWSACVTGAVEADAFAAMLRDAGFEDVSLQSLGEVEMPFGPGSPRVIRARITARRPVL